MFHMNQHTKDMKMTMLRSEQFSQGYQEGLTRKDQELMQEEFETKQAINDQENKMKVKKVSDDQKFGRNRGHIADLFKK